MNAGPTITTYVEYLFPGLIVSETSRHSVTHRDPAAIAREAAGDVFAFRFYDIVTTIVTAGGRDVETRSGEVDATGRYYIDAEKLTSAEVAALPGNHSILLDNMRANGWDPILRCRTGNFQPLKDGDVIVSSETGAQS